MRRPRRVDHPVQQQQAGPLLVLRRIEDDVAAAAIVPGAGITGGDRHSRNAIRPGAEIQRVDPLEIRTRIGLAHSDDENCAVWPELSVDDRGGRDANLRRYLAATAIIGSRLASAQHRDVPKNIRGVGVEGIHAVVLGNDQQHIVHSLARNRNAGRVQRLRVHSAIRGKNPQLAEVVRVDIGGRQDFLMQRLARSSVVTMIRQHIRHLRPCPPRGDQKSNQP